MSNWLYVVCALASCLISTSTGQNSEPKCSKLNTKVARWACMKISDCAYSQQLIKDKQARQCGYENRVTKICCPTLVKSTTSPKPPTVREPPDIAVTHTPSKPSGKNPADVAWQKCQEYDQYRYINVTRYPALISQKQWVEKVKDYVCIENLISGGIPVSEKELPHMALIGFGEDINNIEWSCGGTLISEQFILSAAHCSDSTIGPVKWVTLGILNRDHIRPEHLNTNLFRVVKAIPHPQYKPGLGDHDITLYQLERPVRLSPSIRPVCLFTKKEIPKVIGDQALISGWGRTGAADQRSPILLKAKINFIEDNQCAITYQNDRSLQNGFDRHTMICAGDPTDIHDSCEGDSGGPLQVPISGYECMWSQVGITSRGVPFCGGNIPALYTKVANYIPWIQQTVWP